MSQSPVQGFTLHYSNYNSRVFKWSEIKTWIQENDLGESVDLEFIRQGFGQCTWQSTSKKSRIKPYERTVIVQVLLDHLSRGHVFYCRLNRL